MYTNKMNLPEVFETALQPQPYDSVGKSDYSATSLIDSPRAVQLTKRHRAKIVEDCMDQWYVWRGNAVHHEMESVFTGNPRYLVERKVTRFDKPVNGSEADYRRVVAKFDLFDKETGTLSDWKTCSSYMHGSEGKQEWIDQLNINAYFLEKDGYSVKDIAINAIYMDWRPQSGRYKDDSYPSTPFNQFKFKVLPLEERESFYRERLRLHVEAESLSDDMLPACTEAECWGKPEKFAVYKVGAAKATRLLNSEAEAKQYIIDKKLGPGFKIEHRKGERTRCEKYCPCKQWCNQYQEWRKSNES